MRALGFLKAFWRDRNGAGAAEFALILPIFIIFVVGIIDAGRYAYEFNRGEKATQIGVRMAVVTNPLVNELTGYSYTGRTVGSVVLNQGDRIPADALGTITCASTGCTCASGTCLTGSTLTLNQTNFDALLLRVQQIYPKAAAADLRVDYTGSGLGYAGNPTGMDVAPFVTVRILNQTFRSYLLFGATMNFPDFAYTLTMEDGAGTQFN